jgi:dephospho-CoA kinase
VTRVLGLTGGIATGKSTVARLFERLGAVVIDADRIVHEIQAPGQPALAEIAAAFGAEMLRPDGSLDRERLGALVFRDADARARLNAIVHPRVGTELARRLAAARAADVRLILLDVPLLLETGGARGLVEGVIVVYAPEEQQIRRQMERDSCPRDEAERRVRAQLPIEEKRRRADHVIDNSGSLDDTEAQVRRLFESLCGEAA